MQDVKPVSVAEKLEAGKIRRQNLENQARYE